MATQNRKRAPRPAGPSQLSSPVPENSVDVGVTWSWIRDPQTTVSLLQFCPTWAPLSQYIPHLKQTSKRSDFMLSCVEYFAVAPSASSLPATISTVMAPSRLLSTPSTFQKVTWSVCSLWPPIDFLGVLDDLITIELCARNKTNLGFPYFSTTLTSPL